MNRQSPDAVSRRKRHLNKVFEAATVSRSGCRNLSLVLETTLSGIWPGTDAAAGLVSASGDD